MAFEPIGGVGGGSGGGGSGSLVIATRSDDSRPAVFATFAALETYTATASGTADANAINVSNASQASTCFVVGTLTSLSVVTQVNVAYIRVSGAWVSVASNLVGPPGVSPVASPVTVDHFREAALAVSIPLAGESHTYSVETNGSVPVAVTLFQGGVNLVGRHVNILNARSGTALVNVAAPTGSFILGGGISLSPGQAARFLCVETNIFSIYSTNFRQVTDEQIRDTSYAGIRVAGNGSVTIDDANDTVTIQIGGNNPTPPTRTENTYLQSQADNMVANFVTTGASSGNYAVTQHLAIPTFTGSRYVAIAQPADEPDLTRIDIGGINQLAAFTKSAATAMVEGNSYEFWYSDNTLVGSIVSGQNVIISRG